VGQGGGRRGVAGPGAAVHAQSVACPLQGALARRRRKPSSLKTVAMAVPTAKFWIVPRLSLRLRRKVRFYKVARPRCFNDAAKPRAIVVFNDSLGRLSMRRQILPTLLVGAAVLVSTELRAQQPAPPNLDAVPEKMPFSNP